jgi:hypothetical protein
VGLLWVLLHLFCSWILLPLLLLLLLLLLLHLHFLLRRLLLLLLLNLLPHKLGRQGQPWGCLKQLGGESPSRKVVPLRARADRRAKVGGRGK